MQYNQNSVDSPNVFSKQDTEALSRFRASDLIVLFNKCFADETTTELSLKTYLISEASEPIYLPFTETPSNYFADQSRINSGQFVTQLKWLSSQPLSSLPAGNKIFFTKDYFASALHEIAHWCIAGPQRRSKVDYGYWYTPDGRSLQQQLQFETVEVKPQAIEWAFSLACNKRFSVSNDNLTLTEHDSASFERAVEQQVLSYFKHGFPERAQMFLSQLSQHYSTDPFLSLRHLYTEGLV